MHRWTVFLPSRKSCSLAWTSRCSARVVKLRLTTGEQDALVAQLGSEPLALHTFPSSGQQPAAPIARQASAQGNGSMCGGFTMREGMVEFGQLHG